MVSTIVNNAVSCEVRLKEYTPGHGSVVTEPDLWLSWPTWRTPCWR